MRYLNLEQRIKKLPLVSLNFNFLPSTIFTALTTCLFCPKNNIDSQIKDLMCDIDEYGIDCSEESKVLFKTLTLRLLENKYSPSKIAEIFTQNTKIFAYLAATIMNYYYENNNYIFALETFKYLSNTPDNEDYLEKTILIALDCCKNISKENTFESYLLSLSKYKEIIEKNIAFLFRLILSQDDKTSIILDGISLCDNVFNNNNLKANCPDKVFKRLQDIATNFKTMLIKLSLLQNIKHSPILRTLSYDYYKTYLLPAKLPENLHGNSITYNTMHLYQSPDGRNQYFSKYYPEQSIILIQLFTSILLNIYGCDTPKGKIFINNTNEFEFMSKREQIYQFCHTNEFEQFFLTPSNFFSKRNIINFSNAANLMSKMLIVRDADANPNNYCMLNKKITKIDHDFSFSDPFEKIQYTSTERIPHIKFLERILGVKLYMEDPTTGEYFLNTTCLNDCKLPKESYKLLMIKILMEHIKNGLQMPKEITDYVFSDNIVYLEKGSYVYKERLQLKNSFYQHISKLENLFKPLEQALSKKFSRDNPIINELKLLKPSIPIDYSNDLNFLKESNGISLHGLKKVLKIELGIGI